MSAKVYLDTNFFIVAFETDTSETEQAWWLLDQVEQGLLSAVTSELTLAELLVKPFADNKGRDIDGYQRLISADGGFEVHPVNRNVLILAAQTRATMRSVRLPDAIHIATARHAGCFQFVSADLRMPDIANLSLLRLGTEGFAAWRRQRP